MTRRRERITRVERSAPSSNVGPGLAREPRGAIHRTSSGAETLLDLQRKRGNAFVQRLVQSQPRDGVGMARKALAPAALILRDKGGSTGETTYVEGDLPDLKFGSVVLGPSLRSDIRKLKRMGDAARSKRGDLDAQVEYLTMAADPKAGSGQQAVKDVAAAGTEAKRLSKGRKEDFKDTIDKYNTTKPRLRSLMIEIESARQTIVEKTRTLESKVFARDIKAAQREEAKTAQEVADLQEKKASANKALDEFLGFAMMLADPKQGWTSALDAAAGHVGSFLKDLAFGGTYATQIAAAQERLADIRRRIVSLEDGALMAEIEAATAALNAARLTFQAKVEALKGLVYEADSSQEDLQERLGGLGKKGQAASRSLSEGSAVIEIGNEAIARSVELRNGLSELESHITRVATQANNYRQRIDDGLGDLRGNERAWSRDAAIKQVRNAGAWTQWVKDEMAHLQKAQDFLTAGSYRTPFEEGVENELTRIRRRL